MATLLGLLVPYGVRTKEAVDGGTYNEQIERGAFTPHALDAHRACRFVTDHDRTTVVSDARVRFVDKHSGLYVVVGLPETTRATALLEQRASWRGLSLSYDRARSASVVDWVSLTRRVTHVEAVVEVSIVMASARAPAYEGTWIALDSPSARGRVRSENEATLRHRWRGLDYRTLPKAWTLDPQQSSELESHLSVENPDRERLLRECPRG